MIGKQHATMDSPGARTCANPECGSDWPPAQVAPNRFEPIRQCLACGRVMRADTDPPKRTHAAAVERERIEMESRFQGMDLSTAVDGLLREGIEYAEANGLPSPLR